MVFKKPVFTVYESDPVIVNRDMPNIGINYGSTTVSPRTEPTQTTEEVEIFKTNFLETVKMFNRVMLSPPEEGASLGYRTYASEKLFDSSRKSVTDRLAELQAEIKEFEDSLEKDSGDVVTEGHVQALKSLADSAAKKLSNLGNDDGQKQESLYSVEKKDLSSADVVDLTQRLEKIRLTLGADFSDALSFLRPLALVVEDLKLQVEGFTSRNDATVNTDLSSTIQQVQEYQKNTNHEMVQKVNDLYDTLNRWNTECQILPQLLEQLKGRAHISENAKQLSSNNDFLQNGPSQAQSELNTLTDKISSYREIFSQVTPLFQQL